MANTVIPAEKRIDGMYGEVWVDQQWWADCIEITGTITSERRQVNPAGSTNTYHKRGRTSREGSFRLDKVDSRLEKQFITSANKDLATRRATRGTPWFPKFNMLIVLDDPDAWGREEIICAGCELWTMPLGFSIAELRTTELQFTWDYEQNPNGVWITQP